jgi:AraC-like DNA-binding protein/CheY-like chemotaxis protein
MQVQGILSRRFRILVIDRDSPDYLRGCRSAVGEWEIVVSASLPKDVYRPIGNAFDLVVLDLTREDSPVAAIREVSAVHSSVPLVVTTATGSEALAVLCFRLGALDYFRKPIAAEEFRSRVRGILRAGGMPNEKPALPGEKGIYRAIAFIIRNCDRRILLAQAAREAGMSVSCFARTFRRQMEETFVPYVNKLRVAKAIRLLEESDLSMSEIAVESGFTNQYHFTRVFKKLAGAPPREFRRRLRERGRGDRSASLPLLVTMFDNM